MIIDGNTPWASVPKEIIVPGDMPPSVYKEIVVSGDTPVFRVFGAKIGCFYVV